MSEEINDVLNISSIKNSEKESDVSYSDETTLKTIANICLWAGIISSIVLLFSLTIVNNMGEANFSFSGLITAVGVLMSSISLWAFFKVVSNISISLKKILETK